MEFIDFTDGSENPLQLKLDNICRLCCKVSTRMHNIFSLNYAKKLSELASIQILKNDGLPHQLCDGCKKSLEISHKFINTIKASNEYLKNVLKRNSELLQIDKKEKDDVLEDDAGERVYVVIIPEKHENSEVTVINSQIISSEHSYPKDKKQKISDNLLDYVRNFGKDVVSDLGDLEQSECYKKIYKIKIHSTSCPVCNFGFNTYQELVEHLIEHQDTAVFIKIDEDDNQLSPSQGEEIFMKSDVGNLKIYKINLGSIMCKFCNKKFDSLKTYSSHIREKHKKERLLPQYDWIFTCPVCSQCFNVKKEYLQHLSLHTSDNIAFVKVNSAGYPVAPHKLETCFTQTEDIFELVNKMELSGVFENMSDIVMEHDDRDNNIFRVLEPFYCIVCLKNYKTCLEFSNHLSELHLDNSVLSYSFSCPVCKEFLENNDRDLFYDHLFRHKNEGCTFFKIDKMNRILKPDDDELDIFSSVSKENCLQPLDKTRINSFLELPVYEPDIREVCSKKKRSFKLKKFECDICNQIFNSKLQIIYHLRVHNIGNYCCEKCGKLFNDKSTYKRHFSGHTSTQNFKAKKHQCFICFKIFSTKSYLEKHLSAHNNLENGMFHYICEVCGSGFTNAASLKKHTTQHYTNLNKVKKCDICSYEFQNEHSYTKHVAAHANLQAQECNICKFPLLNKTSIVRHSSTHNSTTETFDCKECSLSFLTKDSLNAHEVQIKHNKNFLTCGVCCQVFYSGKQFSKHIKTHPNYKPRECNLCGKRLSTSQSLMLHMGKHFESNALLCPHCGKKIFDKKNYKRHLLMHSGVKPFKCNLSDCTKSFYTQAEFKRHKNYHENKRDYRCEYCQKRFHEASHLKVHKRVHTGERPYTCPHCRKSFVTRTRCKQHIKLVHNGEGYDFILTDIQKEVPLLESET